MEEILKTIVNIQPDDEMKDFVYEKNEVHHEFPDGMDYKCERDCNETEYPNENELPLDDPEELIKITFTEQEQ